MNVILLIATSSALIGAGLFMLVLASVMHKPIVMFVLALTLLITGVSGINIAAQEINQNPSLPFVQDNCNEK